MMVVQMVGAKVALSGSLKVGYLAALKAVSMDAPMAVLTVEARADSLGEMTVVVTAVDSVVHSVASRGETKAVEKVVSTVVDLAWQTAVHSVAP